MTLIFTNDEIAAALSMRDSIEALEDAFREQAQGRTINQIRYDVNVPLEQRPERNARYEFKTMVGILPKVGVAALRMPYVVSRGITFPLNSCSLLSMLCAPCRQQTIRLRRNDKMKLR